MYHVLRDQNQEANALEIDQSVECKNFLHLRSRGSPRKTSEQFSTDSVRKMTNTPQYAADGGVLWRVNRFRPLGLNYKSGCIHEVATSWGITSSTTRDDF